MNLEFDASVIEHVWELAVLKIGFGENYLLILRNNFATVIRKETLAVDNTILLVVLLIIRAYCDKWQGIFGVLEVKFAHNLPGAEIKLFYTERCWKLASHKFLENYSLCISIWDNFSTFIQQVALASYWPLLIICKCTINSNIDSDLAIWISLKFSKDLRLIKGSRFWARYCNFSNYLWCYLWGLSLCHYLWSCCLWGLGLWWQLNLRGRLLDGILGLFDEACFSFLFSFMFFLEISCSNKVFSLCLLDLC